VDVEMTPKMYNDYCSVNGYPIPGYTYISTQTVRQTPGTDTVPTGGSAMATAVGGASGNGPTVTVTAGINGGSPQATMTVFLSSSLASQTRPWTLMDILGLLLAVPMPFMLGLADNSWTYTEPAIAPYGVQHCLDADLSSYFH
jgi:hypothetical protein